MKPEMTRIGSILILLLIFSCCPEEKDLVGIYTAKNFTLSIDSLVLEKNGMYSRSIYDKRNSRLLFNNKGKWEYDGSKIVLFDFLPNMNTIEYHNDSVKYDNVLSIQHFEINCFPSTKLIINKDLNYYYKK